MRYRDIMIWVCDRCAREGIREYVCMVRMDRRPPAKGVATWEDGREMRCDRCEWKSADESE